MKRRDEVAVGLLVTIALVVLVVGSLWLARGGLSRGYTLNTRFGWGQNLKQGQPVLLAGVNVGYVEEVKLRRAGYLDVQLSIAKKYSVPRGSTAQVQPVGIFGDVAIALNPPNPAPESDYAPGDTVPAGTPIPGISDILLRVDSIGETIIRLEDAFERDFIGSGGLKDVRKETAAILALTGQLQGVIATQNSNLTATMGSLRESASRIADAATKVSTMIDGAKVDSTLKNVRTASANAVQVTAQFDSATRQLRRILAQIDSGKGSVGLFLRDPRLYNSAMDAVAQVQGMISDMEKNPRKYLNFSIFGGR